MEKILKFFLTILLCLPAQHCAKNILTKKMKVEKKKVHVLCYHTFVNGRASIYDFSLEQLREHIVKLKINGFTFITLQKFVKSDIIGKRNILVTIDDGSRSVYKAYFKVFKPMGIKPVIAVYPGVVGNTRLVLNWKQIKELSDDGCSIVSHGYYHSDLARTKKLYRELTKSKKVLEDKLNIKIKTYVYPFGSYNPKCFKELKDAGYEYAFNIKNGVITMPVRKYNYELSRYMFLIWNDKKILSKIIGGSND